MIRWFHLILDVMASIANRLKLSFFLIIERIFTVDDLGGSNSSVDVVITWVDGGDPLHRWKRSRALSKVVTHTVSTTSKARRRFSDNEELRYCIRSIRSHAPWVRRIWLLTDHQFPSYFRFWAARKAGIRVVTHKQVFSGIEGSLPTFNSLSIESVLWRIPGLSENFIYFNDDVFLTAPVIKEDFFSEQVLIRGRKRSIPHSSAPRPHVSHQINAFNLLELDAGDFFSPAHYAHPLKKSVLEKLFGELSGEFSDNLRSKFRGDRQFWPIALAEYYMVANGLADLRSPNDGVAISVSKSKNLSKEELDSYISRVESGSVKFLCVNFMEKLEEKIPDVRGRLENICGPALPFERS